jgi:AcrR family transcriptional regulator
MRAALKIVDRDGLNALSIRRVASELGVSPMSLYYYVPNKDAILDGIYDLVIAKADLPAGEVSAGQWVRGAADAFRRLAVQHPRAYSLLTSRPVPLGDAAAAEPLEAGLAAFARQGMDAPVAYATLQAVCVALLSLGELESQAVLNPGSDRTSHVSELSPERFPLLSAVPTLPVESDEIWDGLVALLVRGLDPQGDTHDDN